LRTNRAVHSRATPLTFGKTMGSSSPKTHDRKAVPLSLIAAVAVCGIVAKIPYREFIYSSGIRDWGIAGALPNFFAAIFMVLILSLWRYTIGRAIAVTSGLIAYEFSQHPAIKSIAPFLYSPTRTFDPLDVVASVLGCAASLMILRMIKTDAKTAVPECVTTSSTFGK
jgi:hypothetical protein